MMTYCLLNSIDKYKIGQTLNSQKASHNLFSQTNYGISFVGF